MEIRTVIRHFNVFSHSFRYGFWTLRAFSRWYSGWFGEMGYGWDTGFRGGYRAGRRLPVSVRQPARPSPAPSGGPNSAKSPPSATFCHHLPLSGAELASVADPPPLRIPIGISLQFLRSRVMDGSTVITAQGERSMNGIPAETASTQAGAPAEQPKPAKKPRSAASKAHVAPSQARSGRQATPAEKANTGAKSAPSPKKKATGARQGSKTAKVLDLLRRSDGASLKEVRKATGWQGPSVLRALCGAP